MQSVINLDSKKKLSSRCGNSCLTGSTSGISVTELGLIIALISIVVLAVMTNVGIQVGRALTYVATALEEDGVILGQVKCGCTGNANFNCNRDPDSGEISCGCSRRL